jgi:choline-glycine betaine transporter
MKIDCWGDSTMWFAQMWSYGENVFYPIAYCTIIMLSFYFVTSSDSGSHVVDCHASNGALECPPLQKIYWSVTEGSTAMVLLLSGTDDNPKAALTALRAVSIVAGVPITVFICFYCVSLYKYCDVIWNKENNPDVSKEMKELEIEELLGIKDNLSIMDVLTAPSSEACIGLAISIVAPV